MDRQGTARRIALFALALAPFCASPALALDARIRGQLEKLTPEERLEQRCDMEAMDRIGGGKGGFRPDKVIAYAFGDPKLDGTTFKTKGAVFRSKGEKTLTDSQITDLVTKGKTSLIKGFKNRDAKAFDAHITFDKDFRTVYDFPPKPKGKGGRR